MAKVAVSCVVLLVGYAACCFVAWFRDFEHEFFDAHWLTEEAPFNEPPAIERGIPCEDVQ